MDLQAGCYARPPSCTSSSDALEKVCLQAGTAGFSVGNSPMQQAGLPSVGVGLLTGSVLQLCCRRQHSVHPALAVPCPMASMCFPEVSRISA
jgi:hypothetical protein